MVYSVQFEINRNLIIELHKKAIESYNGQNTTVTNDCISLITSLAGFPDENSSYFSGFPTFEFPFFYTDFVLINDTKDSSQATGRVLLKDVYYLLLSSVDHESEQKLFSVVRNWEQTFFNIYMKRRDAVLNKSNVWLQEKVENQYNVKLN